jgi:hypothetical protein
MTCCKPHFCFYLYPDTLRLTNVSVNLHEKKKQLATADLSEPRFPAKPSGWIHHTRSALLSSNKLVTCMAILMHAVPAPCGTPLCMIAFARDTDTDMAARLCRRVFCLATQQNTETCVTFSKLLFLTNRLARHTSQSPPSIRLKLTNMESINTPRFYFRNWSPVSLEEYG